MTKRKTIKKQSINKYLPPIIEIEPKKDNFGGFSLNPNNSDRISFNRETDTKGTIKISNVSYEIKIDEEWIWIVRYDDHGGKGALHRHERINLESDIDVLIADGVKRKGTKKKLYDWAIADIKKNYLIYRMRFLKRIGIDLY